MVQDWKQIFDGNELEVFCSVQNAAPRLVVTFDYSAASSRPPDIPACSFFAAIGFDQIHISTKKDNWYQTREFMEVVDHINSIRKGYEQVVTYGNSMGAYGAMLISGLVNATRVIAFAPQFSVDPLTVPNEHRWQAARDRIDFIYRDVSEFISKTATKFIIYDPFYKEDQVHVDMFRSTILFEEIKLPFAGHYPASALNEANILVDIMKMMIFEEQAARYIAALRRKSRRQTGIYLIHLSQALARRGNLISALRVANIAYAMEPDRPEVLEALLSITYNIPDYYALSHVTIRLLQLRYPTFTHYNDMRDNLTNQIKSYYKPEVER